MADERFDNEDLENLPPEEPSVSDRVAEEAGQLTRELGERPVRDYVRKRTDEYRDQIDSIRKARREQSFKSAKELGQGAVDSAAEGLAGRGTGQAGTQAAKQAGKTGAQTVATGASQAGAAAASQTAGGAVAGQVVARGAVQTGAKVVTSTGIKAIVGAALNFVAPIIGFVVGWIIGEIILRLPIIGKLLEKVGEAGCKLIMLGCQILVVVVMALIGVFIATVMGLVVQQKWGASPTNPPNIAKAEQREIIGLLKCVLDKDPEGLEVPAIKGGDENTDQGSKDDGNPDAIKTKTADPKKNQKESDSPQLKPSCVTSIAEAVKLALEKAENQLAYFEQVKPKNLDALKKSYEELKKFGKAATDAGADFNKAKDATEKFLTAYKVLEVELAKISVSCEGIDLNLGKPTNGGFYEINPSTFPVSFNFFNKMYTTKDMACYLINLKAKLAAVDSRLQLSINQLSNSAGQHSGHGGPRAVADVHIPYTHPDIAPYNRDLALKAYEVVRSMSPAAVQFIIGCRQADFPGVVTNWSTNTIADCTYYIHDNHWHIHIPLRN